MRKLFIALLALPLVALAEDKDARKRDFSKTVRLQGTVVCLGCELEKDGADAQCTLHAKHAQGLRDADGNLWSFVDNLRGHDLVTGESLRGREIRLRGWTFPKARFVEAWQYEVKDGDAWVQWSYCRDCGWEKGDYGDTDLCGDCKE